MLHVRPSTFFSFDKVWTSLKTSATCPIWAGQTALDFQRQHRFNSFCHDWTFPCLTQPLSCGVPRCPERPSQTLKWVLAGCASWGQHSRPDALDTKDTSIRAIMLLQLSRLKPSVLMSLSTAGPQTKRHEKTLLSEGLQSFQARVLDHHQMLTNDSCSHFKFLCFVYLCSVKICASFV